MEEFDDDLSDDMELEQELINNYWQMPLPKGSSSSRRTPTGEIFPYQTIIAENNRRLLEDMAEAMECHSIDEAIDKTMEQEGEVCSIIDLIDGQRKPRKLRKTKDLRPMAFVDLATRSAGKPKPITIKALLDSGGSGTLVSKAVATKLKSLKENTPWCGIHLLEK